VALMCFGRNTLIIAIVLFVRRVEKLQQLTSLNHESRVTNSMNLRFYSDRNSCKHKAFFVNFTIIVDTVHKIKQRLISFSSPAITGTIVI